MTDFVALLRQFAPLVIEGAKMAGADSPAFAKIAEGVAGALGRVPELAADTAQVNAALDDAIKGRKAASQRLKDRFRPKPR